MNELEKAYENCRRWIANYTVFYNEFHEFTKERIFYLMTGKHLPENP